MSSTHESSDFLHFFRSWIASPKRISAVAPSSDALGRLITQEITPASGPVIELGPGTGVFTKALLARGVDEGDLTLIEFGSEFVDILKARFPRARVLPGDASKLPSYNLFPDAPVGAVVSGLPLLSMSPRMIASILSGSFSYMRPGGAYYQFTYGPKCPVPRPLLDRLGLKAVRIGHTVLNLPPAAVYRITQRQPLATLRRQTPSGK